MATIKFYDITKKEEEIILSLFRIPITFFGTSKDNDDDDTENDEIDNNFDDVNPEDDNFDDNAEDDDDDNDNDDVEDDDDNNDDDGDAEDDDSKDDDNKNTKGKNKDKDKNDEDNDSKDNKDENDKNDGKGKNNEDSDSKDNKDENDDKVKNDEDNDNKDNKDKNNTDDNKGKNDEDSDSKDNKAGNDTNGDKGKNVNDIGKNDNANQNANDSKNNREANVGDIKGNDKSNEKNKSNKDTNKEPNSVDNARKMKPKDSSPGSDNKPKPKDDGGKNIPGADKALKAKNGLDAIKNAKDDPMGAVEKGGTELAKQGAKAIGNAVAPGVGEAATKAVEVADKLLEKTEVGKKVKRACCITSLACSCLSILSAVALVLLPILLLQIVVSSIFGTFQIDDEVENENPQQNFIEVVQEDTLNDPGKSLITILENALEDVGYYKQKEADEKDEDYEDENGSSTVFYAIAENYYISSLKYPMTDSKPEDYPEGQDEFESYYVPNNASPYFSMEKKHIPLFQDVLDNILESEYAKLSPAEQDKANVLKKLFNSDSKIVEFIDNELTERLDKQYDGVYNPLTGLKEDGLSFRKLFEETSTIQGDTEYDLYTVSRILGDIENKKLALDFFDLQEGLAKVEVMTYMQAFRQFNSKMDEVVKYANEKGAVLPDVYYSEEFFAQFSTISDVATYFSLATLCDDPAIVYEIAREHIYIYKDPVETSIKTIAGKSIAYIPVLKTWYANYTFDLIQSGSNAILQCTGCTSKSIDEQSWEDRSNILKRYNIDDKEQFFILFMEATGIDPVEGEENIYSPSGLDDTWQTEATFNIGSTKAYSSGIYSYTSNGESYSGSFGGYKSTDKYLNSSGASFPVAASNVRITMNFMERYPQYVIDKYGTSEYHRGIDYAVPIGTPVLAIREGVVLDATHSSGYGYYVKILHPDGSTSTYGHGNGVFNVKKDDIVTAGTQIMESGNSGNSTGPHMHLEVSGPDGKLVDPNLYMSSRP